MYKTIIYKKIFFSSAKMAP